MNNPTSSAPLPFLMPSTASEKATLPTRFPLLDDDQTVMTAISVLLERSGLSQSDVARALGVTAQALNQYACGRRRRPSVTWLARLAAACGAHVILEFPQR